MTADDKQALVEFLSGAGVVIGITSVILVLFVSLTASANWAGAQPTPSEQRFQVVDEYKGCDVIQYNPDGSARYSYFLDCRK